MEWKTALLLLGLVLATAAAAGSLVALDQAQAVNAELRTQIKLLREIRALEAEKCDGIYRVNVVCEEVVTGFATQLGLEPGGPSQLLTTTIVKRHRARQRRGGIGGGE